MPTDEGLSRRINEQRAALQEMREELAKADVRVAELEAAIREHREAVEGTPNTGDPIDHHLWSVLHPLTTLTTGGRMFHCYDILTRRNTRQGRGEVLGARHSSPNPDRPDRVWVKWEGSKEEPDHYIPNELDYFNPETDEA
jgi:hypothetical protein